MKRRNFLKGLVPVSAAAVSGMTMTLPMVARAAGNKRLIVVFQRGGCDGLNAVVPHGDDDYYNNRPNLALAAPSASNPESAVSIDSNLFSLHPAMGPLADIYLRGDMAIMPSVHFPQAERSHFVNQRLIEQGMAEAASDGWLNRYLQLEPGSGELPAVSMGTLLAESMRGEIPVPVLNQFGYIDQLEDSLLESIRKMYAPEVSAEMLNRKAVHIHGRLMLENLEAYSDLGGESYTSANGAVYPDSEFGSQMRQLAHIIKSDMGMEIATVNTHGWDTHRNQGAATGSQANSLGNLAEGLAAFHTDLGSGYMQDTLVLVMTEFGRTVSENASGGTDHGHASTWYAIGGGVIGGIHGTWPGLSAENLYQGRYLNQTVDSRDIICEVLSRHLGQWDALGSIIPGHFYQSVGFL